MKILIVDDNKNFLTTLSTRLAKNGFHTEEAESGRDSLSLLQDSPYDLLLADINMPEMDGIELAETVNVKYPDTGIILMSGDFDFRDTKVFRFWNKRMGLESLMKMIKKILNVKQ